MEETCPNGCGDIEVTETNNGVFCECPYCNWNQGYEDCPECGAELSFAVYIPVALEESVANVVTIILVVE